MQGKKVKKGVKHSESFNYELYKKVIEIKNIKNGKNTKTSSNV